MTLRQSEPTCRSLWKSFHSSAAMSGRSVISPRRFCWPIPVEPPKRVLSSSRGYFWGHHETRIEIYHELLECEPAREKRASERPSTPLTIKEMRIPNTSEIRIIRLKLVVTADILRKLGRNYIVKIDKAYGRIAAILRLDRNCVGTGHSRGKRFALQMKPKTAHKKRQCNSASPNTDRFWRRSPLQKETDSPQLRSRRNMAAII